MINRARTSTNSWIWKMNAQKEWAEKKKRENNNDNNAWLRWNICSICITMKTATQCLSYAFNMSAITQLKKWHTQTHTKYTYQYDVNDAQNKQTRTEVFTMIIVIIKFQCKWLFVWVTTCKRFNNAHTVILPFFNSHNH